MQFLTAIFLTALYAFLLLDSPWGLGFPIINTILISILLFVKPELRNKQSLFFFAASFILSLFLPLRAFEIGSILTLGICYLLNVFAVSVEKDKPLTLHAIILSPILMLVHIVSAFTYWIDSAYTTARGKSETQEETIPRASLIRGIFIAVPIALIFIFLFSSADPLFGKYLENLVPQFNLDQLLIKRIFELLFFFGLFSAFFRLKPKTFNELSLLSHSSKVQNEIAIAAITACIVIGLFLLVQVQYLFAGDSLIKELGMTHSEYTRNGFGQLVIVSTISLSLVALLLFSKDKKGALPVKAIGIILLIEVLLLLASAGKRVYLYQEAFGFTQARLMGILFATWLAGILLIFAARLTDKLKENELFFAIFVNTVLVIMLMNVINIDFTVAARNKDKQPNLGFGIDHAYIMGLSNDAYPAWGDTLTKIEAIDLCTHQDIYYALSSWRFKERITQEKANNNWHNLGTWTLPDSQAQEFFKRNGTRIGALEAKGRTCQLQLPLDSKHDPVTESTTIEVQGMPVESSGPIQDQSGR